MNDIIEHSDDNRFANGQSCRDLRVRCDASEVEIQLMEAIDNIEDLLRFVEISTSAAVACRWRLF